LLDASDVQANQAEREAIKDIKKEIFALKKETAQVTLHNVEALRNLTPAQDDYALEILSEAAKLAQEAGLLKKPE
jgi:hypothetical protein